MRNCLSERNLSYLRELIEEVCFFLLDMFQFLDYYRMEGTKSRLADEWSRVTGETSNYNDEWNV